MSKIYEEKERFVRTSLKSLLFDIDKNILDVYYKYQNDEEYVVIEFIKMDKQKVCVTGDSLLSITKDVLRAL